MRSFDFTVTDELGIHARPAGMLVKEIKKYQSSVTVTKNGNSVAAHKLMALMSLSVKCGDTIKVEVCGPDEDCAAENIEKYMKEHL